MPRTLKITLAYDGTRLVGWQRQPEGESVQGLLEEALGSIEGRPVTVIGAGRTDAGVHALGQVASCTFDHALPVDVLTRALNAKLPVDVRVLDVDEADEAFHARYSARSKTYRYLLLTAPVASPFERSWVWHLPQRLDVDAMAAGAATLVGEHDFASLQGAGSAARTTVRRMTRVQVGTMAMADAFGAAFGPAFCAGNTGLVVFEFTGDGFLRHMVRNAVGSLVEVGTGRQGPSWIQTILASRDRTLAGMTAPAGGLFLVAVEY